MYIAGPWEGLKICGEWATSNTGPFERKGVAYMYSDQNMGEGLVYPLAQPVPKILLCTTTTVLVRVFLAEKPIRDVPLCFVFVSDL